MANSSLEKIAPLVRVIPVLIQKRGTLGVDLH